MDPFLGNMRPFKSTCSLGNQSQHGSRKHLGRLHVGAFIYVMELPNDGSFMLRMENVDVRYCLKLPVTEASTGTGTVRIGNLSTTMRPPLTREWQKSRTVTLLIYLGHL